MTPRTWIIETQEQLDRLAGFLPKLTDFPLEISAKDYHAKRTISQNKRLWKLHGMAAEITGYTPDEMHEEALCHHFGYHEVPVKDLISGREVMKRVPNQRSSERNKEEFSKFMESVSMWYASELGVWLGD